MCLLVRRVMDGYDNPEQMRMMLDDLMDRLNSLVHELELFKAGEIGFDIE